jgi:hypothetical protein
MKARPRERTGHFSFGQRAGENRDRITARVRQFVQMVVPGKEGVMRAMGSGG